MNLKNLVYYWGTERRVAKINEKGILPSGGIYGTAVYMSINPLEFYNICNRTHLFVVDLRGIESHIYTFCQKKWLLSTEKIPLKNTFYVGGNFESEENVKEELKKVKNEIQAKFHRARYSLRQNLIEDFDPKKFRM
jgi:hypothetical protein